MKKEDMICANCINFSKEMNGKCSEGPLKVGKYASEHCSRGQWYEWNYRLHEWSGPFFWGEWEREPTAKKKWEWRGENQGIMKWFSDGDVVLAFLAKAQDGSWLGRVQDGLVSTYFGGDLDHVKYECEKWLRLRGRIK